MSDLLTPIPTTNHVIAIEFIQQGHMMMYDKSELFKFNPSLQNNYLYKRDFSGRPGLFLSGRIGKKDIIVLKGPDTNHKRTLITNKISWFAHGKLVSKPERLASLSEYRRDQLADIFQEFVNNQHKIVTDVINILPLDNTVLLVIMINNQFPGQIDDYVNFFRKGVLAKKDDVIDQELICSICNRKTRISAFKEPPIDFFYTDKTHFFENSNPVTGFPLCDDCYLEVQSGLSFVKSKLNYGVPLFSNGKMKNTALNFLLIPHLSNHRLMSSFKTDLEKNNHLYLNSLKDLCLTLKSISKYDNHQKENVESLLKFSALFYTKDKRGLMRVISYVSGIYPAQLEALFRIKEKIDERFREIAYSFNRPQDFFIGLPLLTMFYKRSQKIKRKNTNEAQQENAIIQILSKMFTGQQIPTDEIIVVINAKIRELSLESYDLQELSKITFLGLMLIEYFIALNNQGEVN